MYAGYDKFNVHALQVWSAALPVWHTTGSQFTAGSGAINRF